MIPRCLLGAPASIALLAALLGSLAGCDRAPSPAAPPSAVPPANGSSTAQDPPATPWFAERAAPAGIDFVHSYGRERRYWIPETVSGGVALLDHDGDGDLDIYLVQGGDLVGGDELPGNRLYRNDGGLRFVDVTEAAGVGDRGYGVGCACADYDRDGDTDIYVTNVGPNVLYRNDGDGTFTDVTAAAGVGDPSFGSSAAFGDLDGDLYPELYIANYVRWSSDTELVCQSGAGGQDYCAPNNYKAPAMDTLYRNRGDGTFEDISAESGCRAIFGNGLGVVFGDLDGDGAKDIYVANDGNPNQLWRQVSPLRFADIAVTAGCAVDMNGLAEAGMGVTALDVDEDGDLDIMLTHLRGETNTYYRNEAGSFIDATVQAGLAGPSRDFTGFGVGFADFDHDGSLDLYVGNGRVARTSVTHAEDPYAEPNQLYAGLGGARFREVQPRGGTEKLLAHATRGIAFGDLDEDGDIDVVAQNSGAAPYLLENIAPKRGGSIQFTVLDREGREALDVPVTVSAGGRTISRIARRADGYCASNDPRVHVGLGSAPRAERVVVTWPGGVREEFGPFESGSRPVLRQGAGD